jgi:hypothetical protein
MIFIPTYKRASNCKAAKLLSQAVICCHKSEVGEYARHNSNQIQAIPDDLAGKGMGVIRNWILDNNSPAGDILMVDDDVSGIGYYEGQQKIKLNEVQIYEFIENAFRMCRELGTVLWGLNLLYDKQAYREYSPFSLTSVVLGPFMGIISNGLRFDTTLGLKEDFDYSIQVLNRYRKVLRFNKYHYMVGHLVGKGGCTAYRTTAKEREQKEKFVNKWGSKIVQFKDKDTNPVIKVPISGI